MGGVGHPDMINAVIEFAREHSNMILVGSEVRSIPILKAIKALGANRVCFGSDTPFEIMHVEIAKYNALLDGEVTDVDKKLILGGNIERIFNL